MLINQYFSTAITKESEDFGVTNREIAKRSLQRLLNDYESQKFRSKKELDDLTQEIVMKIKLMQQVDFINNMMSFDYLSKVEKKYLDTLHLKQFEEERNHIINFKDDFVNNLEREFLSAKKEKENVVTMAEWKRIIKNSTSSNSSGHENEREGKEQKKVNKEKNEELVQ